MHQYMLGINWLESSFAEGPWSPHGQQADYETAMCPCIKEGRQHPWVR